MEQENMGLYLGMDISEKYKEILKSFNHQNPITDYSKSYQEISKAMDKFNYNTQYLELIKSISELDQSKVLQLQKKLGMINKHNAEDDE